MDRTIDELSEEISNLRQVVAEQSVLLNKIILMIHLSDTDLKNYLDSYD